MIHVAGREKLAPEAILHLDSDANYTVITLKSGQKIIVSKTLKVMEARLSAYKNFVRVNKSTILNTDYAYLKNDTFTVINERVIVFSRRKWRVFQMSQSEPKAILISA